MKNLLQPAIGVLLFSMLICGAAAQNAYFNYVEEPTHPRSAAMGGSGTALSSGGFSHYNPAGIATLERPFVAFAYGQQWSDLTRGYIEGAWLFPKWFVGVSFKTQSISFTVVDNFGTIIPGEGTVQGSELSLQVGWRNERFALGVAANGLHHHLYDVDAYALSASGGLSVSLIPGKLLAGAAVVHAGGLFRGVFDNTFITTRDRMPTTPRIGISLDDTLFEKLPVTLQVDALYSMNFLQVMVPVGIELRPIAPVSIRAGKRFNHPTDLFTCGIGVNWENLSYNIALIPTGLEGDPGLKWTMGLTYSLARKKRKTPPVDSTAAPTAPAEPSPQNRPAAIEDTTVISPVVPHNAGETVVPTVVEESTAIPVIDSSTVNTEPMIGSDSLKATIHDTLITPATPATEREVQSNGSTVPAPPSTQQEQAPSDTPAEVPGGNAGADSTTSGTPESVEPETPPDDTTDVTKEQ